MIENIFTYPSVIKKQLTAPMVQEREQYLTHLSSQGVSAPRVRTVARMLLHVIRLMKLDCIRVVDLAEIKRGSELWNEDSESHTVHKVGPTSGESFHYAALKWLRFHNMIAVSPEPTGLAETISRDFALFMKTRGMSVESIRVYTARIEPFLQWALSSHESISSISLLDVDEFLKMKQLGGGLPRTIASFCTVFRLFFRYAEMRGWTDPNISKGIRNPRIVRYDPLPKGPPWKQIRRLLDSEVLPNSADLRASTILFLCSIYGLRRSEIVNLTLSDFDWVNESFVVRRAKRGRIQQFPIQFEVGEAILKYLRFGRPRCPCRNLFVTLKPPYKAISPSTMWTIIANRIRRLDLNMKPVGPHSFRHACATELLRTGSSLKEIADFLGHRNLESVSIYAKADIRSLRKVAAFSLASVR
jgi:integrase/recombinase XerD